MIVTHLSKVLQPPWLQGKAIVALPPAIILPLPDDAMNTIVLDAVAAARIFLYPTLIEV
jgi:hypothetical protein